MGLAVLRSLTLFGLVVWGGISAHAATTSAVKLESLPPANDMGYGALHLKAGVSQISHLVVNNQDFSFQYPDDISTARFELAWGSPSLRLIGEWSVIGSLGYARYVTMATSSEAVGSEVSLHTIPLSLAIGYEARFASFMDWLLPGAGVGFSLLPFIQNGVSDGLTARGLGGSAYWFVGVRHHLKKWLGIGGSLFGEYRQSYGVLEVGRADFSGRSILAGLTVPL